MCILALAAITASAQQKYTGTVTDSYGDGLPGVVVQVLEANTNTVTGVDGSFAIAAKEGQTIQFTCLGLETVTIKAPKDAHINVTMKESAEFIEETVVVGYGVTKKRDLAGSVSSIKTDEVKAGIINNTAELLKGRAAGVYVHTNSNEPGGSINIRIRGTSSIDSNNEPLYVIDGVLSSADNNLAPEDIENIEILKDASSTAIYGARGANGVVIITTKRGKEGKVNVDYSYNASFKNLYHKWDLVNAQDLVNYNIEQWKAGGSIGNPPYTDEELATLGTSTGTDWITSVARTGVTQTHNLSISGGNDRLRAAAMIGYLDNQGTLPNSQFNRFNARVNVDYNVTKWLKAGAGLYMVRSYKTYLPMNTASTTQNIMYQLFLASPLSKNDDSGFNWLGKKERRNSLYYWITHADNNAKSYAASANAFLEATFAKDFTFRAQADYNFTYSLDQCYYDRELYNGQVNNGEASVSNGLDNWIQADGILTYHHNFANKHDLKVIAGTSFTKSDSEYNGMGAHGFSLDAFRFYNLGAASSMDNMYSGRSAKTTLSFFGRAEYVILNRYIINASFRADGASNFGQNNKWGYFPAVSAAWQLADEPWMSWIKPVVSQFKIRASWGQTGNDGIGLYKSQKMYGFGKAYLGDEQVSSAMYLSNAGNSDLTWETTTQTDVGFDAIFAEGKLEFTFDWYKKITTNLLNNVAISYSNVGLSSTIGNNGVISNTGLEAFLKWHIFEKKNFSWDANFTFGYNKNKVEQLAQTTYYSARAQGGYNYEDIIRLSEGDPLGAIYGYVWEGVLQEGETYAPQPKSQPGDPKFKDLDGDGVITSNDREIIGVGTAPIQFGIGSNMRFWDFDFSFFLDGSAGGKLFNMSTIVLEDNNRLNRCLTERWSKKNPSNTIMRTNWTRTSGIQYGSWVNSNFVEDASFVRLSNIELGYNIPCKKLRIDNVLKAARVYVGGQKLFDLTKYSGFDPEVSSFGSDDAQQGLDYASYPSYRTFNVGVKVTF